MTNRSRPVIRLEVLRTERLTTRMIRMVAGGAGITDFQPNGFADSYVKVLFPKPDVVYSEPLDLGVIQAELPRSHWPSVRSYTVRYFDKQRGELALDFVSHGDVGLGGPWAARAAPGDELLIAGPGGAYSPSPEADWHLLVGDESALPAIAVALEQMPQDAVVLALIEVSDAAEQQPLVTKGNAEIRWLRRSRGEDLALQLAELDFPLGQVHAFVHGEADMVRAIRRNLLAERGVSREWLSVSGYWRRGCTDEERRAAREPGQIAM